MKTAAYKYFYIKEKIKVPLTLEELQEEFFKLAKAHNDLINHLNELKQSGRILSSFDIQTQHPKIY